jgi:cytochrome P450
VDGGGCERPVPHAERRPGLKGAHPAFADYIDGLADERRRHPQDDLLTRMVNAEVDGQKLSVSQIRSSVAHLIMAGNETTANLIANLLHHLLSHPEDYDRVRADRSLLLNAIEESLRIDPPVLLQPRTTVEEIELRGTSVPKGARVILSLAAANHDPSVFDDPESFDIDRDNAALHCSFGAGAHFCPGAALARMEARVAINTFLDRIERAELPEGFEFRKHRFFVFNGPQALPARIVTTA